MNNNLKDELIFELSKDLDDIDELIVRLDRLLLRIEDDERESIYFSLKKSIGDLLLVTSRIHYKVQKFK